MSENEKLWQALRSHTKALGRQTTAINKLTEAIDRLADSNLQLVNYIAAQELDEDNRPKQSYMDGTHLG